MYLNRRIAISIASVLASLPVGAWAACNQIPSTDLLRSQAIEDGISDPSAEETDIATELARRSGQWTLPFKGALGRASRARVFADPSAGIAVAPDSICVGGGHEVRVTAPAGKDELVAVMFRPTRARGADALPVYAQVFASAKLCDGIGEALGIAAGAPQAPWHPFGANVRVLAGCSNEGVAFTTEVMGHAAPYMLSLPVPPLPAGDTSALSANVRIAVFRASVAADALERVTQLANPAQKCKAICGEATLARGLDVCIDDLYETLPGQTLASTVFVQDAIACNVAIPPDLKCDENDFKGLCAGSSDATLASCDHSGKDVKFWQDNCGTLHFPFTYAGIRRDTANTAVDRLLAGATGAARKKNGDAVYLPGKEFAGASLCVEQCDKPPCTGAGDWRLPDLDVWYKDGSTAVAGLQGLADKDASVIDVVPALRAVLLCDVAEKEACTGVGVELGTRRVVCACADRYPANCTCKAANPPEYFECQAPPGQVGTYAYAGMPCTRHNHCPGGGYCKAQPKCRPSGQRIWGDSGPGGSDCQDDSTCPGGHLCGFRLFDLQEVDGTTKLGDFIEEITGSGRTLDRRGYCRNDVKKGCKKKAECSNNKDCDGYGLEAWGKP